MSQMMDLDHFFAGSLSGILVKVEENKGKNENGWDNSVNNIPQSNVDNIYDTQLFR